MGELPETVAYVCGVYDWCRDVLSGKGGTGVCEFAGEVSGKTVYVGCGGVLALVVAPVAAELWTTSADVGAALGVEDEPGKSGVCSPTVDEDEEGMVFVVMCALMKCLCVLSVVVCENVEGV